MRKILVVVLIITLLAGVVVNAEPAKKIEMKDISGHWAKESIESMISKGVITGFPDGSFQPNEQITRAQFTKMLVQAMEYKKIDSVSFEDLKPFATSKPHWASVYIETALRNGVIEKSEIGENFFPHVPLTRKDMGMMMFRALKLTPSTGENPFADITEANGNLTKLYEEYLIRGTLVSGKRLFNSEALTTRAEAAAIIARMIDYKRDPAAYVARVKKQESINMPLDMYNKLISDKKNLDGKSMDQANKELLKSETIEYYTKDHKYTPEELVDRITKLSYDYVMADWNIDYRTVEKTYADSVKGLVSHDAYKQDVPRTIKYYKDNKLVQEAIFYTNHSFVYKRGIDIVVRGTVIFRFMQPTSENFLKRLQERDNGKILTLGQWYSEDIEVEIAGDAATMEKDLKVFNVKMLNQPKAVER